MIGLDVGGFNGEYIYILKDLGCDLIYCFEPLFYDKCLEVSKNVQDESCIVKVYEEALYQEGKYRISVEGDASSLFHNTNNSKEVNAKSFLTFIAEERLKKIDYIKLNCEGSEYVVLGDMLNAEICFEELFVQFHEDMVGDTDLNIRKNIVSQFKKKGYIVHGHKRWIGDKTVWWSISKTPDLKLPSKSLNIRESY